MYQLSFPECNFTYKQNAKHCDVFDVVRKKYVRLTPEEWVRQHVVHFLLNQKGFSQSLMNLEVSMKLYGLQKRADIVCYTSQAIPCMVVECKAPEVKITQESINQAAHYNILLKAPFLLVTNGIQNIICKVDFTNKSYIWMQEIPSAQECYSLID